MPSVNTTIIATAVESSPSANRRGKEDEGDPGGKSRSGCARPKDRRRFVLLRDGRKREGNDREELKRGPLVASECQGEGCERFLRVFCRGLGFRLLYVQTSGRGCSDLHPWAGARIRPCNPTVSNNELWVLYACYTLNL
ncbi:uncharacterized protein LOC110037995, partial [Phalaenopsis equestris]|uniref:uncharacterized protein LOC110037995 n=1 Tax=Phalaenopsis equestris TaxID=78828 RepID=UPI0009E24F4E